jgi:hypothetical protein
MSRLLLAFVGVIIASLFLVRDRPVKESFADAAGQEQVIKAFLNHIQYDKGRIIIGFYTILLVNRIRRFRTNGDTTLDKDIANELANQMKERSRWDNFEAWMKSCSTTAGTPMEGNLITRVRTLPVDSMNYLRFMNALITLYRDEFAMIRNEKVTAWTRREIDEGTAQDNYTPPTKVPETIGSEMEKYLTEHIRAMNKIWPTIEKISLTIGQESRDMNELLIAREKMPNGFTMKIYVDFEEKVFQKPLAQVMKYMIDNQAQSMMFNEEGQQQMTLENAKISTTLELVKLSKIDFIPWFVPIYKGQKKTYKERFTTMGFDPNNYMKLGLFCITGLQTQVNALRNNLKPVENTSSESASEEGFQVEHDDFLFEYFESKAIKAQTPQNEEDQYFTGQVRDIIYRRFTILNQAEPAFKEQIKTCRGIIDEIEKFKKGVSEGKFSLSTLNPLKDDETPEGFFTKRALAMGKAL